MPEVRAAVSLSAVSYTHLKAMLASWSQYYGPYYNTRAGFAAMRPLWFNMLQQVFNGTDPQAAADEFNASANSN